MQVLLGSKSPRRQELLEAAGIVYSLVNIDSDEEFPADLDIEQVAEFLAIKKSKAFTNPLDNSILLTADTTVCIQGDIINKPENLDHAIQMLKKLSGQMHTVCTGVCFRTSTQLITYTDKTNVYFKELSDNDIEYYVNAFKPLDKAGAYGIQDWIGYIGVHKIEGDYFNVMGLPINRVFDSLKNLGNPSNS